MTNRVWKNCRLILTAKCGDYDRLHSLHFDQPLHPVERLAWWGHWLACGGCRHRTRQMNQIEHAARGLDGLDGVTGNGGNGATHHGPGAPLGVKMPEDMRARLTRTLAENAVSGDAGD